MNLPFNPEMDEEGRQRLPMIQPRSQPAYSLYEVLVVLALIGIVATMGMPKLLAMHGAEANRAKLRQTAVAIEQAYYDLKNRNKLRIGQSVYYSFLDKLALDSTNVYTAGGCAATGVFCTGEPLAGLQVTHPCGSLYSFDSQFQLHSSYVKFPNGVYVMGLYKSDPNAALDRLPWNNANHNISDLYMLCFDTNGSSGPNALGEDVYFGFFNAYGAFNGTPKANGQAFWWGGEYENITSDSSIATTQAQKNVLVGFAGRYMDNVNK